MLTDTKFYSGKELEKIDARYYLVFGERSNGKTTYGLEKILKGWIDSGYEDQGAYLRRYDEEIKGGRGSNIWNSIVHERGLVEKWTDGEYDEIVYRAREWFLAKRDIDTDTLVVQNEPFAYAFAINMMERTKGASYPGVETIVFDEFLTRGRNLIDEFVLFQNMISTIVRRRGTPKIYMFGNTVNAHSIYFREMGLNDITTMEQGDIRVYEYHSENKEHEVLKVAVEYADSPNDGKESDVYFAFDNPKLSMITSGSWELPMYPHAPFDIKHDSIKEIFFIEYHDELIQGDIVIQDSSIFIYFHEKTTPIHKDNTKMEYRLEHSPYRNHGVSLINNNRNKIAMKISELIRSDLVFYQDNQVGEIVRNYMMEAQAMNAMNI